MTNSPEAAKEQAAEYFGFAESEIITITLSDGTTEDFEIPNPALLGDEQQERYNQLQFDVQQCDRQPDLVIPDHKLNHRVITVDGEEVTVAAGGVLTGGAAKVEESENFVPARTIRGQLIEPFQKTDADGVTTLLTPGYNARLAIALWGEERYQRFRDNGGNSRLINLIWTRMNRGIEERATKDPKSDGGPGDLEAVPEGD